MTVDSPEDQGCRVLDQTQLIKRNRGKRTKGVGGEHVVKNYWAKTGMVSHACYPSTREADADGSLSSK